jgi:hypothetical protein
MLSLPLFCLAVWGGSVFCFAILLDSYVLYVCVLLHTTLLSGWVGWSYFTKTTCACLLIWEPVGASVRLVHPRTWFKPTVAICFPSDRSKAVTPQLLICVNCLWCLFWNCSFYKPCSLFLFSSWLCGEVVFSECGTSWYAYSTFLYYKVIIHDTFFLKQRRSNK